MVIVSECCRLLTERVCKRSTSCNRSTIAQVSLISAETLQLESDRSASQQLCDIRRVLSRQTASVLSSCAYWHCSHSRVCVTVQCLSVCQSVCLSHSPATVVCSGFATVGLIDCCMVGAAACRAAADAGSATLQLT